jgi:hypothetical protein
MARIWWTYLRPGARYVPVAPALKTRPPSHAPHHPARRDQKAA